VIFSFLGTVGKRKGFDLLINAFANASKEHPDWRLWIIGPRNRQESQNIDEAEVEEIIKPYKDLESKIHYWGRIDDRQTLATIIGASDVFVFPAAKKEWASRPWKRCLRVYR